MNALAELSSLGQDYEQAGLFPGAGSKNRWCGRPRTWMPSVRKSLVGKQVRLIQVAASSYMKKVAYSAGFEA